MKTGNKWSSQLNRFKLSRWQDWLFHTGGLRDSGIITRDGITVSENLPMKNLKQHTRIRLSMDFRKVGSGIPFQWCPRPKSEIEFRDRERSRFQNHTTLIVRFEAVGCGGSRCDLFRIIVVAQRREEWGLWVLETAERCTLDSSKRRKKYVEKFASRTL